MDEQQKTLRQLTSLARLRNMQKAQSAAELASANQTKSQAESALYNAEARYQLAMELQRRKRADGQALDPVIYGLQLAGTDTMRETLATRRTTYQKAAAEQNAALLNFASRHVEHKLIEEAAEATRTEIQMSRDAEDAVDAQDQGSRSGQVRVAP